MERLIARASAVGVAIVAAGATWIFFSLTGPDLRSTCSARPSPDPAFGPGCFLGPRPIGANGEAGLLPALIVFVTVIAVVAVAAWISGRRSRG